MMQDAREQPIPHAARPLSPASYVHVLIAPRHTFAQLRARGGGVGMFLLLLLVEWLLLQAGPISTAVARMPAAPLASFAYLWSSYLRFALLPGVSVYALGIVLYYRARHRSERDGGPRLPLQHAAVMVAHAWLPHTLLVALGLLLARAGMDHVLLPHHPMRYLTGMATGAEGAMLAMAKFALAFGPSVVLGWWALRAAGATGHHRTTANPQRAEPTSTLPSSRRSAVAFTGVVLLVALLIGGAGVGVATQIAKDWQQWRPPMPGEPMAPFALTALDGSTLRSSSLHGHVVLLDFWATWCPPCVASMPALSRLHTDLGPQGFALLSVNVEWGETAAVTRFAQEHRLPFPIYMDDGRLQGRFQVHSYPTAFLFDRTGVLRHVYIGETSARTLRRDIEKLLAVGQ